MRKLSQTFSKNFNIFEEMLIIIFIIWVYIFFLIESKQYDHDDKNKNTNLDIVIWVLQRLFEVHLGNRIVILFWKPKP